MPQYTENPTNFAMHLFEVDDDQRFENSEPLPECGDILNHDIDIAMELEATQVDSGMAYRVGNTNQAASNVTTDSYGYVLVIDNIDMNVRCSFQRIDQSTESLHFCHAYAVLN